MPLAIQCAMGSAIAITPNSILGPVFFITPFSEIQLEFLQGSNHMTL